MMTLELVRDWLRNKAVSIDRGQSVGHAGTYNRMADAIDAHLSQPQPVAQGDAVVVNHCIEVAADALKYLAENDMPKYGNDRFNSEHCHQLSHELRLTLSRITQPATPTIPTGHRAVPVEPTEAMIESACEAIQADSGMTPWDSPSWEIEGKRDHYRKHIRAAITAALAASPSAGGV